MASIFLLFKTIVFLLVIIFLIKISLTSMKKYSHNQSKSIEIVERLTVGKESSLSIVLVCGKYYLMSMTPSTNELIRELDEEDVRLLLEQKETEAALRVKNQEKVLSYVPDFSSVLKKRKGTKNEKIN
ncbi:flagellar biosynthetic protein FliO [Vagococcus fluvialis]|uniref:flagellar biosynthetic protein FliO n=1 Tax=Vagococcus fluvialis TaxID=2738 RepID=UPI003B5A4C5F